MSTTKNIFAIEADDQSLQTKSGGVFGLNSKATFSEFKYEEGVSNKDQSPYKSVVIAALIGDKEFKSTFFLNESVYTGNGNDRKLLSPGDEGYEDAYYTHYVQVIAVIKHTLGALGVTKDTINRSLAGITGAQLLDGIKILVGLAPVNFTKIPVDIFLEYQWNISEGQDRTYLMMPKNMKGGDFLCPSVNAVGKWEEVISEEGLIYTDNSGAVHPFNRNNSYMTGHKAIQQGVGSNNVQNTPEPAAQAAKKSSWAD